MIHHVDGNPPFVIDKRMPTFFERAPGNYSLVAHQDDPDTPLTFATRDEAVEILRQELDAETLSAFEWYVLPMDRLPDPLIEELQLNRKP